MSKSLVKSLFFVFGFFALAIFVALAFNRAFEILADEYVPASTDFYGSFGELFLNYKNFRMFCLLFLTIFPYTCIMSLHQRFNDGTKVGASIFTKGSKMLLKLIKFPKPWWFWLICLSTQFMPILIPVALWLTLQILLMVLQIVISPILFIITQIILGKEGSI